MSLIKRQACDAFKDFLQANLSPNLGLHYIVGHADFEDPECSPMIAIIPQTFSFEPWQEESRDETAADRTLVEVGTFEGTVELRLLTKTKKQRERIEDEILNLMLSPELAPGIVVVQTQPVEVAGWATTYQAPATFSLEKEEWREEMVFDKKRFTFLDLGCWFPALVMRTDQFRIDHMIQAFNQDLESDVPDEQQEVDEDGNYTNV